MAEPSSPSRLGTSGPGNKASAPARGRARFCHRSEEHTSELQSRLHLVCRLLLEKKKKKLTDRPCTHHQNGRPNQAFQQDHYHIARIATTVFTRQPTTHVPSVQTLYPPAHAIHHL